MPDMIPDFTRCVLEAQPAWFLMENVPGAYEPVVAGYEVRSILLDNRWCGAEQRRRRRFSMGTKCGAHVYFHVAGEALEAMDETPTVVSTGQADWKGSAQRNRATVAYMLEQQGMAPDTYEHSPFTVTELRRAIANGVPLPMGRAVAKAVREAMKERIRAGNVSYECGRCFTDQHPEWACPLAAQ